MEVILIPKIVIWLTKCYCGCHMVHISTSMWPKSNSHTVMKVYKENQAKETGQNYTICSLLIAVDYPKTLIYKLKKCMNICFQYLACFVLQLNQSCTSSWRNFNPFSPYTKRPQYQSNQLNSFQSNSIQLSLVLPI